MSAPDFDQLANLMIEEGAIAFSPSELHGAIVGVTILSEEEFLEKIGL